MSKRIRILSLVLAVLMLVPAVLSGCSTDNNDPKETTPSPTTSSDVAATTPSDAETTTDPTKIDLEGYEFFIDCSGYGGIANVLGEGAEATSEFDEVSAIYSQIEEDLNCTITVDNYDINLEAMTAAAVGGVKLQDFICVRQSDWIPLAMMGGIRALDTMVDAGLDLYNEDNFNQVNTLMSTINGHVYALDITGKYDDVALGHYYAFNKELCEQAGYPADTLYQAVRDGEWDYEMMLEIARKITKDLDGDGVNDIWGIALDTDGNEAWTNGTGPILFDEAQNKWVSNLRDSQLMESLQFMYEISQGDVQIPVIGDTMGRGDRRTMFYQGNAGFAGLYGGNISSDDYANATADIGALPLPKGPDADSYIMNMVDVDTFVTLTSNNDWEKSAKVMNAIGAALTDFDAYKARVLDDLYGDEQALEMLFDYAYPNAMMNIAKCSDDMYQITRKGFYKSIYEMTYTPAQAAEAYNDQVQAELDKVFQQK